MILAIDPGNMQSAYVMLDEKLKPIDFGIIDNEDLLDNISMGEFDKCADFAIEMVASYGMPVGKDVFETVFWIGRFWEAARDSNCAYMERIYRMQEKTNLCHDSRAKDGNIRQALIDRFGPVGTKKNQGWFYGVSKDVWQAIAVGVTYYDMYCKDERAVVEIKEMEG